MCGIAGIVDLVQKRPVPRELLEAMAAAMVHRGPDEDGYLRRAGVGFTARRLSIVGLADGQQPAFNEDRSVGVVFNGELYEHRAVRAELAGRGHRFTTGCDTEILPHLWEEHGESMFPKLRGQFAFALHDQRRRRVLIGRDRFGICPLYWSRQGDWLIFASEIKAILATGLVTPRADRRGIDQVFSFFAVPGPATCFEGVQLLPPGHYLDVPVSAGAEARIAEKVYWEMDFPDRGDEDRGDDARKVIDGFEDVMLRSVERRLRADVPVVSYLSGGVDSSLVVALASKVLGRPIPTYTIRVDDPSLDESHHADVVSRHLGTHSTVVTCTRQGVLARYPELIRTAEAPVIDTSCAALMTLAERVRADGYKVVLTGEGADEWFAGYPWYKTHKMMSWLDAIPGLPVGQYVRRAFLAASGAPRFSWRHNEAQQAAVAGHNAWHDVYGLFSVNKLRFYNGRMRALIEDGTNAYSLVGLDAERLRRWHPLNRALATGARILLAGLLLSSKGDRVSMRSSVEARYPFLDEDVFDYVARLHPRWKLRGFTDKYLLRSLAERWLPSKIAWRKKAMFQAPFDGGYRDPAPPYVDQLLSRDSLLKSDYFDADAVLQWRARLRAMGRSSSHMRVSIEMGLMAVLATQLWHHTFIDASLASLPSATRPTGLVAPQKLLEVA